MIMATMWNTGSIKRAPNFTLSEKKLLADLVEKHPAVRFKNSNPQSKISKKKAWSTLAKEFNDIGVSSCHRPVDRLQKCWHNLIALTKKLDADRKREQRRTGGGPGIQQPVDVDIISEKVEVMIPEESFGLVNTNDDDTATQPQGAESESPDSPIDVVFSKDDQPGSYHVFTLKPTVDDEVVAVDTSYDFFDTSESTTSTAVKQKKSLKTMDEVKREVLEAELDLLKMKKENQYIKNQILKQQLKELEQRQVVNERMNYNDM